MNLYMLIVSPLEGQPEGKAQYMLGIGRSDGQPGFGSTKSFLTIPEIVKSLRLVRFTEQALAILESDLKAQVTHVVRGVPLSKEDFMTLGMATPELASAAPSLDCESSV